MPYVPKMHRINLEPRSFRDPESEGELDFQITRLAQKYLDTTEKRFADYARVIGVLESVKLELYRRVIAPYEDTKAAQHGDVY